MANLEQAILDGSFHQGADVDAEPVRPASPSLSAGGHSDDEDGGGSGGAKLQRQDLGPSLLAPEEADARYSSVWSRPASHSTGPKGVLADFRASSYEDPQLPGALEKVALGEDRRDGDEIRADSGVEAWRKKRLEELKGSRIGHGLDEDAEARFGRFREIGVNSFESAVLDEDPSVKVVLHVFEPVRRLLHFFFFHLWMLRELMF